VAIEVAAELRISRGLAASHIRYAHALRVQFPQVGQAFIDGDIDEATFRALVFRTGVILDGDVLAGVDAELAIRAPRWGSMNRSELADRIDKVVSKVDRDAVRLCRANHLAKTFWGWRDEQLRDGTAIWTSPAAERYITHPGSAIIFPSLCAPTGPLPPIPDQPRTPDGGDKTAKMPRRQRTRAQQRAAAILAERRANREHRIDPTHG
jgi:hypothetical protein